jgi:RimJ/RimL family protein N-acetyltransferase
MGLELRPPSREDVEQVRLWRNEILYTLRTPYPLTNESQGVFYENVICSRDSNHRYWAIYDGELIGFGGLTNIEWENGLAEISLILSADRRVQGYGARSVQLLLDQGFGNMGLKTIYGECYECNPAVDFWKQITDGHGGYYTMIPRRKLWQGQLYDALHFSIWR